MKDLLLDLDYGDLEGDSFRKLFSPSQETVKASVYTAAGD